MPGMIKFANGVISTQLIYFEHGRDRDKICYHKKQGPVRYVLKSTGEFANPGK
jgi:hypothetical protein